MAVNLESLRQLHHRFWPKSKKYPPPLPGSSHHNTQNTFAQINGSSDSTERTLTPTSVALIMNKPQVPVPTYLSLPSNQLTNKFHEIKLMEDERIHDAIVHKGESKWSMQSGVDAFDLGRNRYTNILPFDRNRVILDVREGFNDYINASHITLNLDQERQYIATQGPTKATISHFWQMVLQQTEKGKDAVIVMVTPLQERNVKKCSKYWTDTIEESVDIPGFSEGFEWDLKLQCLDFHDIADIPGTHYTMLQLDAIDPASGKVVDTRCIHHVYYDKWTDFMKPEAWEPIHSISNLVGNLNGEGNPLFVHCSAGVGRTGTYITLDYLFHSEGLLLNDRGEESDVIEKIIKQLRQQRLLMVQSLDQFKFCYEAVLQFFRDFAAFSSIPSRIFA